MRRCAVSADKQAPWIWGDKTPNNMLHLPLLADAFPGARVLHIIRDPRDRSASVRRVWGADPLLAAEAWARKVTVARRDGVLVGDRYRELIYENLVADVSQTMQGVCAWLGLPFDERVTRLDRTADRYAVRGEEPGRVAPARARGYLDGLSRHEVRRIEEIVAPVAAELGYLSGASALERRGVAFRERLLRVGFDRGRKAHFFLRRWGFAGALRHMARRAFVYPLGR
jgi:hypothetical protein